MPSCDLAVWVLLGSLHVCVIADLREGKSVVYCSCIWLMLVPGIQNSTVVEEFDLSSAEKRFARHLSCSSKYTRQTPSFLYLLLAGLHSCFCG